MGKTRSILDADAERFIAAQHVFFVASAPLDPRGHVNLSPKGLDRFRILRSTTVAYLDFNGSGVELSRVTDSCGYGVPVFRDEGEREQLPAWARHRGREGLKAHREQNNQHSIDGLPGVSG
jgi:hypothetical protein